LPETGEDEEGATGPREGRGDSNHRSDRGQPPRRSGGVRPDVPGGNAGGGQTKGACNATGQRRAADWRPGAARPAAERRGAEGTPHFHAVRVAGPVRLLAAGSGRGPRGRTRRGWGRAVSPPRPTGRLTRRSSGVRRWRC